MKRRSFLTTSITTLAGSIVTNLFGSSISKNPLLAGKLMINKQILNLRSLTEVVGTWRMFCIRTPEELAANSPTGDQEQHYQGLCRSVSNPQRLYIAQDVGAVRRSDDGGTNWKICQGKGFETAFFTGIECDPVCENVVMVMTSMRTNIYAQKKTGIWRSIDGGVNWTRAYAAGNCGEPRTIQNSIAYAPSSIGEYEASRWYAAFADLAQGELPADAKFIRSYNGGRNWEPTITISAATYGDAIYVLKVHPTNPDLIYMGSPTGLFTSTNAGSSFSKISSIPEGACTWIEINPANGNDIFFSIAGKGAYHTTNAFAGYSTLFSMTNLRRARPNPSDWNIVYAIPVSSTALDRVRVFTHALSDPSKYIDATIANVPGKTGNWNKEIVGNHADILPDPVNTQNAFGFGNAHFFRTENRTNWIPANQGHSGACWGECISTEQMFDQLNPDRLALFCTDMGMAISSNRGASFEFRNPPYTWVQTNLNSYSLDCGALQPIAGSKRIIATSKITYSGHKLIYSPDDGLTWSLPFDEIYNHWCIGYSLTEPNYAYAGCRRSSNGGETFEVLNALVALDTKPTIVGISRTGNPSVLYAMDVGGTLRTRKIWKSIDRGNSWTLVTDSWKFSSPLDNTPVFRVHPTNEHVFFTVSDPAGEFPGSIAKFDTNTSTWTTFNIWQAVPRISNNNVRTIAVDPRNPDVIYVQLVHPGMCHILRSVDGGATWENITADTHTMIGTGLEVNPHTGELLAGGVCGTRIFPPPYMTENSIYETLIWGNAVETTSSVCYNPTDIHTAEHNFNENITAYPNPTSGLISINLGAVYQKIEIMINDVKGNQTNKKRYIGKQIIEIEINGPAGIYFASVIADGKKAVVRVARI